MAEVLLKNCDIYTDERKVYLDASILIDGTKIIDIYHGQKKDYAQKVVDLGGKIIIPAFCSLFEKGTIRKGVGDHLRTDHMTKEAMGLFKDLTKGDIIDQDTKAILVNEKSVYHDFEGKVVFGHSHIERSLLDSFDLDAIGPLYEDLVFDVKRPNLVTEAFLGDKYVLVKADELSDEMLGFTLKNIKKDKLILLSDDLLDLLKRDIELCDLTSYLDINVRRFLGQPYPKGRLMRGSQADLIILSEKREFLFSFIRGKLCR